MIARFHNPITRAFRSEETVERVSEYRDAYASTRSNDETASMVAAYFRLITDFYEYGWGPSFHFAPIVDGASFDESLTAYEHYLGEALELQPGRKAIDLGCGVGGPQRSLARKFGCSITALNISEYQLEKCADYNRKAGLTDLCSVLHGDFMSIPVEDESFDAVYQFEAVCHARDKSVVYDEIFRILKPGGLYAGYDWSKTPSYDPTNPEHREIKERIDYSNALDVIPADDMVDGLRAAGLEILAAHDRALASDPGTAWYNGLESGGFSIRGLARSTLGRQLTTAVLRMLEPLRIVPEGTCEVHHLLNMAADSLVAGGRLGIFSPNYFCKARKPLQKP